MNWSVYLAVAAGGALGSMGRLGVAQIARAAFPAWPWGTWLVNVLGSVAIGVLMAWFSVRPSPEWVRLGLMTGLLGGFTTFSAFSLDAMSLLRAGSTLDMLAYVLATVVLGVAGCALGLWLGRGLLA